MLVPSPCPAVKASRCCRGGWVLRLIAAFVLAGCSTAPPMPDVSPAPSLPVAKPAMPAVVPSGALASTYPRLSTPPARPDTAPHPMASMLAFADRVRTSSGAELSSEIARIGDPGDAAPAQMQLALALAVTRVPADLARALGLLQRVMASQSSDAAPLQPLARVLAARYLEQRRVEDDRDRQVLQLREAQRRIDQLNDRLEALRAIERSVTRPNNHPAAVVPAPVTSGAKPGS